MFSLFSLVAISDDGCVLFFTRTRSENLAYRKHFSSYFFHFFVFFFFFYAGRGFVRKIVIPFLLGLKFKTTVLIPIAIAIIALKTWKALTLGLLSLVLSAAMVIYRFTKPKVVGVEILHYPSPVHTHHHDGYAHARAYSAQQPEQ